MLRMSIPPLPLHLHANIQVKNRSVALSKKTLFKKSMTVANSIPRRPLSLPFANLRRVGEGRHGKLPGEIEAHRFTLFAYRFRELFSFQFPMLRLFQKKERMMCTFEEKKESFVVFLLSLDLGVAGGGRAERLVCVLGVNLRMVKQIVGQVKPTARPRLVQFILTIFFFPAFEKGPPDTTPLFLSNTTPMHRAPFRRVKKKPPYAGSRDLD